MKKFLLLILLTFLWLPELHANTLREFIIDTDLGVDDAIAMLYLLQQPQIKIKAITIEADGNAHCQPAFSNTQYILNLVQHSEIPVACGRSTPLRGHHQFPKEILDQTDSFGGVLPINPLNRPANQNAKDLLIQSIKSSLKPIEILAIGPLTTIAEALDQQPQLKNKIRMIYIMGGAVQVPGNIIEVDPTKNNRVAEWNIYIDPYAAEKVFHSGIPITLIPLDATNQARINRAFHQRIKQQHQTPAAAFVLKLLNYNKKMIESNQWYFWDPMAAVIAAHESLATIKTLPISVRLHPEKLSGATVIDKEQGDDIRVCVELNSQDFKTTLLQGLNFTSFYSTPATSSY